MACGEPSNCMSQMQVNICQLCGRDVQSGCGREQTVNYQKQVDPPAALCDPVPQPPEFFSSGQVPTITHTPLLEYRVTSEVRRKPANQTGVTYIMNHGAMSRADVEAWISKKKRMAEENLSWVGDGTYVETHPDMLHFYGNTTHMFLPNPDKPYGNSPPPQPPYSQIIPDSRYDEDLRDERRRKGKDCDVKKAAPLQVCIPIPVVPGQTTDHSAASSQKADCASPKCRDKDKDIDKDKEKEANSPRSSPVMKAACLPGGGCPPPVKMMLCLPCPPPDSITGLSSSKAPGGCTKAKPVDYTYRCESRELRGGNLYSCCQCVKRNGLQHDCPRTPCQGRPACLTKPWPDCWASGGCHGIDYSREKGVKRYDPCREQRFDKKECKGPDSGASNQASCGGNMMVVVCPKITSTK